MSDAEQSALTDVILAAIAEAPLFTPGMPKSGRPFSVRMTNLGPLGWVSDRRGYRYQASHPETGLPWPAIPDGLCWPCGAICPAMATTPRPVS